MCRCMLSKDSTIVRNSWVSLTRRSRRFSFLSLLLLVRLPLPASLALAAATTVEERIDLAGTLPAKRHGQLINTFRNFKHVI